MIYRLFLVGLLSLPVNAFAHSGHGALIDAMQGFSHVLFGHGAVLPLILVGLIILGISRLRQGRR